ncbi:RTA1 like protein-domain-containing protein [Flagelloscypha sp. PMI_526]|nr:RTA1 like protein-domain-containing protein [Flagelloscypha sp. PMI_526]
MPYGYTPTKWVCFLILVLFGLSALLHLGLAVRYRMWWLLPTILMCSLVEALGWAGRLWSSYNMFLRPPFDIQLITTIIAPTFTLAGMFIILGKIMGYLGAEFSRLSPKLYSWIFVSCDVVALMLQAAGGGIAAGGQHERGSNIALGGILFQVCVLVVASALSVEYFIRFKMGHPIKPTSSSQVIKSGVDVKVKQMVGGLLAATLLLFTRAIYRSCELGQGWGGSIITTQAYFVVLDGLMLVFVQYVFILLHPGRLLPTDFKVEEKV